MPKTTEQNFIEIPDYLTVRDLAALMNATPIDVIKELMRNGIMAGINQQIDYDTAAIVAAEMGFDPHPVPVEEAPAEDLGDLPEWRGLYSGVDPRKLTVRPPVVTILGHVDHGKTSLLDKIRRSNVTEGEFGGITQHIGAYQVEHNGAKITFLDTPGHEAFTSMRARGAKGADIAILVVAADDGVMPQTREAIAHVRAARVPIIVALNKIDKPNANPDRVKQQLNDLGLVSDEWGGDTLIIPISALSGMGIDDLLEAIVLVASDTTILADPSSRAAGTVIEAELDRTRGVLVTLLVQNGTLRRGDIAVVGPRYGKIKAMFDEYGRELSEAGPSSPVRVMGLSDIPDLGSMFRVVEKEKEARAITEERQAQLQVQRHERRPMSMQELFARYQAGETKELNLVIKVDVNGSLEPVVEGLKKISVKENDRDITINILHADVGNVTESDIMLASASDAVVVGFNVIVDGAAARRADAEHVEIRQYNIIYKLFEETEAALKGMLEPVYEDKVIGLAEVRQVFKIPRIGKVAGSYVLEGEARRDAQARVLRNNKEIHKARVTALKRFQDDAKEVRSGYECGINVEDFDDFQEGDRIEFIVRERVR